MKHLRTILTAATLIVAPTLAPAAQVDFRPAGDIGAAGKQNKSDYQTGGSGKSDTSKVRSDIIVQGNGRTKVLGGPDTRSLKGGTKQGGVAQ
jgi:hypothetical protein